MPSSFCLKTRLSIASQTFFVPCLTFNLRSGHSPFPAQMYTLGSSHTDLLLAPQAQHALSSPYRYLNAFSSLCQPRQLQSFFETQFRSHLPLAYPRQSHLPFSVPRSYLYTLLLSHVHICLPVSNQQWEVL